MEINIKGFETFDRDDTILLTETLKRISCFQSVRTATVFMSERLPSGWHECISVLDFEDGSKFTLGSIQRARDEKVEFHS